MGQTYSKTAVYTHNNYKPVPPPKKKTGVWLGEW